MDVKLLQRVKVVDTDNLSETILQILETEKYQRPLFVMDHFLAEMPLVKEAQKVLADNNIQYAVFDKVVSDPPAATVMAGVQAFNDHQADSIVAIGGGSSIDVARGINIVRVNGGEILDYAKPGVTIKDCPGLIAIPTTSGTGSEMSNALVVTDVATKRKLAILAEMR